MSVSEGQPTGPVRPIPIHLTRLPGVDETRFKFPINLEKPTKSAPSLWNPALDLCSSATANVSKRDPGASRKPSFCTSRALNLTSATLSSSLPRSVVQTPSTRPSVSPATSVKSSTTSPPPPVGALKAPPVIGTLIHEQIQRHFPSALESPLAVLASKGLFPSLLGAPESVLVHSARPTISAHTHLSLALPERHMALQNVLAVAHSRAVMERITSSHSTISRGALGHHQQQPHSLSMNHSQQNLQQLSPNPQQPSIPHLQQPVLASDRPISLQSAIALAQSRALVERVCNNPVLTPVISLDNNVFQSYGRKFFPCPQCRYTTDRRNNLKRHMLTMHQTSSKMLECCGILFNTKASLREHAMIFHYHGYTCYFCGRRFCRKALLKRHLSVHNGQKDFVCNVCDYATSHKSNLERHRKVHSRQDEGKDGEVVQHYHDNDVKSNGSEAVSHDDVSSDELSVCSDYGDDIDVEINVHSD